MTLFTKPGCLEGMHESTDYGNSTDVSALCFELKAVLGGRFPPQSSSRNGMRVRRVSPAQESEQL